MTVAPRLYSPPRRWRLRSVRPRSLRLRPVRLPGERIQAEDAFFLHVESAAVPQQVGGVALFDVSGLDRPVRREDLVATVTEGLLPHEKFRRMLDIRRGRTRMRWREAAEVDLDWHVGEAVLQEPTEAALCELIARVIETPLPRDRPLWRCWLVHGPGEDRGALLVVMHHVLGDGTGVVADLLALFKPALPLAGAGSPPKLGPLRRAAAVATGLAQLATDGSPVSLPRGAVTASRQFVTLTVPLADIRQCARQRGVRVTDVVLTAVAGALARTVGGPPAGGDGGQHSAWPGTHVRASMTMLLGPGIGDVGGNRTAAVMVDLPAGPMPAADRLAQVARSAERRRRSGRPLASRFVMTRLAALLPSPLHARFARAVYRGRFFGAIVSNMPGPQEQLTTLGAPVREVYPILPLAEEVPLAVGALSWNGGLNIGVTLASSVLPDGQALVLGMRAELAELCGELGAVPDVAPGEHPVS